MNITKSRWRTATAGAVVVLLAAAAQAITPAQKCEKVAAKSLRRCVRSMNGVVGDCYEASGAACTGSEPKRLRALTKLNDRVLANCPDAATVAAAGYGPGLTPAALMARLQEACVGDAASLAARAFGGPHAVALTDADPSERACLLAAHAAGARLVERTLKEQSNCALRAHRGRACDTAAVASEVIAFEDEAVGTITGDCAAPLEGVIGSAPSTYARAISRQTGCLTAAGLGNQAPLDLVCGPRAAVGVPARGAATQVVLDEATWGTRCGNGSPYAFQLRLAPAGAPVEKVVVHLQGGGLCLDEASCLAQSPGLFTATDDAMPSAGIMSTNVASNPTFADWTHVFLPYCTQDLHVGGGAVSTFPGITVNRFGALNVRGALRYVRDVLWSELDTASADGYRPDRLQVVFAGSSAGGYGVAYNYQYLLDDLRWVHSAAAPDSALGLDNGGIGIGVLGTVMLSAVPPSGWGATPYMPPYCFGASCPVVPIVVAAHAARLLGAPEQQVLQISNQVDNTQVSTTLFPNLVTWINTMRASYCALQGTPGLHYFLSADTTSIHGTVNKTIFTTLTAGGIVLGDWLAGAMTAPAAVSDAVGEGTLVTTYGANPFGCQVD